jgi:hypothetical protein
VQVRLNGNELAAAMQAAGARILVSLSDDAVVHSGGVLEVTFA